MLDFNAMWLAFVQTKQSAFFGESTVRVMILTMGNRFQDVRFLLDLLVILNASILAGL